jgi:hypothetical protein
MITDQITHEINVLEGKLETGMKLYEESTDPAQKERYYAKWVKYLREYESLCQKRRNMGYVPEGVE